jgi:RNA-directed DNA polymerase
MKESYGEGLAIHTGPESCGAARKSGDEALTGERGPNPTTLILGAI